MSLQLVCFANNTESVLWENPRPFSQRFCWPIRIQFLHKNTEATVNETEYIKDEESKLMPFKTIIQGKETAVSYKLLLTIIYCKVCNAIN